MKLILVLLVVLMAPVLAWAQWGYWCSGADDVWAEVQGTSVIFHHDAALYNCCPNPFEYEMIWDEGQLVIVENEILINGCWCQCCYDLAIRVDDLPVGDSVVVFRWYDEESNAWLDEELEISIPNSDDPDSPPGEKVQVGEYWQSECLATAAPVPDEPDPVAHSWGGLKSRYR